MDLRSTLEARKGAGRSLQVLSLKGRWIVAEHHRGSAVKVYDPAYATGDQGDIFALCRLAFGADRIEIAYGMQKGSNKEECRLLTVAALLDLIRGKHDPEDRTYDVGLGSGPLLLSISKRQPIQPFPATSREKQAARDTERVQGNDTDDRDLKTIKASPRVGIVQVWKKIDKMRDEISAHERHIWSFIDVEQTLMEYLHLTQVANGQVALVEQGMRWHSNLGIMAHLGAWNGSWLNFVRNRYTLMRYEGGKAAREAIERVTEAIEAATTRFRICLVTKNSIHVPDLGTIKAVKKGFITTVALIKPGTLMGTSQTDVFSRNHRTRLNKHELAVVVAQTQDAVGMNLEDASQALEKAIGKGAQVNLHRDLRTHNALKSFHRHSPTLYPTLSFHRYYPAAAEGSSILEAHYKLAGALGILPKGFGPAMRKHGHDHSVKLDKRTIEAVKKIILDTSLEAYRRYEQWMKRDRYGTAD